MSRILGAERDRSRMAAARASLLIMSNVSGGQASSSDTDGIAPTEQTMLLRDGRALGYAEYGDAGGAALFYFHGTPGSRLEAGLLAAAATRYHVRLIGVDRPGFGLSDFRPKRRFVDWPDDVAQLADALGIGRFGVIGLSGGGPHVAACARVLGSRIIAAAIVSGAGPIEAHYTPKMGRLRRALIRAGARIGTTLARPMLWWSSATVARTPARFFPRFPDRRVLARPAFRAEFKADMVEAFRHGSRGAAHEYRLFARSWDFAAREIPGHIDLWHGDADRVVPIRVGRYMAAEIKDCNATFFAGEEHLMIVDHTDEIIAALARQMSSSHVSAR